MDNPILKSLDEMHERLRKTLQAKGEDYAGGKAFHNFEVTAQITGMTREMGVLVRICDKVSRIGMLLRKDRPAVKDESLLDTIEDLVGYATILRAMVKKEEEK